MGFFDLCFGDVHGIYKTSEMGNKKKTKKDKNPAKEKVMAQYKAKRTIG
jgi:hypothetical protein